MENIKINNNKAFLDEKYAAEFIGNLFQKSYLIPGVTYNVDYNPGDDPKAGVVHFHKLKQGQVSSQAIGGDYSHQEVEDDIKSIYLTNEFMKSTKVRGVHASMVTGDLKSQVAKESGEVVREAVEECSTACLVYNANKYSDAEDAPITAEVTSETAVQTLIRMKKALNKKKIKPTIALISHDVESALVEQHLVKGIFTPETNEALVRAGAIGRYLGMSLIPRDELSNAGKDEVVYRDESEHTVDLSNVEIVMYAPEFYGGANAFVQADIVNAQDFPGSLVRNTVDGGFGVLHDDAVLIKVNS